MINSADDGGGDWTSDGLQESNGRGGLSVETRRPWATRTPLACGCAAVTECRIESACGCALTFVRVGGPRHSHAVYSMRFDALRARPTSLQPLPQVREDAVRLLAQREPAIARRGSNSPPVFRGPARGRAPGRPRRRCPRRLPSPSRPVPTRHRRGGSPRPRPESRQLLASKSVRTQSSHAPIFFSGRAVRRERERLLFGGRGWCAVSDSPL